MLIDCKFFFSTSTRYIKIELRSIWRGVKRFWCFCLGFSWNGVSFVYEWELSACEFYLNSTGTPCGTLNWHNSSTLQVHKSLTRVVKCLIKTLTAQTTCRIEFFSSWLLSWKKTFPFDEWNRSEKSRIIKTNSKVIFRAWCICKEKQTAFIEVLKQFLPFMQCLV